MGIRIGIGSLKIGQGSTGVDWSSYWATLISATVENAAPTHVVLTFPSASSAIATDITATVNGVARAVSSASWTGGVWTVVLDSAIVVDDVVVMTFVPSGGTTAVTNNVLASFTLSVIGTGAGVATLRMATSETQTVTLTDNGKFYTDALGTLNESATWELTSGGDRVIYIKLPSGTSKLTFNSKTIIRWGTTGTDGWASSSNAPSITGDVSCFTSLLTVLRTGGNNTLGGDISGLTGLTWLSNNTFTGGCVYSGSISGMTELAHIYVMGTNTISGDISLTKLTYIYVGGNNTLSGSLAVLRELTYVALGGANTVTGSLSALAKLTYIVNTSAANTISGNIAGLKQLYHCNIYNGANLTFTNVTALTKLNYLEFGQNVVCSEAVINQILADFITNKDQAKGSATRVINLLGHVTNNAPTGQGLLDAAALAAYSSPTPPGTAALWTVSYRLPSAFFFGTSITAGSYASPSLINRFSTLYCTADTLVQANYGVGGKKMMQNPITPDGLSMYETMSLIPQKPNHARYLFLEFGANDYTYFPTYDDDFIEQFEDVIDYAITKGWSADNIKLLTIYMHCGSFDFNLLVTAINTIGTSKGVQVIDTGTNVYNEGNYSTFMYDCVHPNTAGHSRMSTYIDANIIAP